ncbi:hypothetical protein ABTZ78_15585 [Streptomyces bauhiniae]|uniref:hypothetical protein n=1 Tax=Streptomyces bauhiniae TaxID=2340725 RepID=UPI0033273786
MHSPELTAALAEIDAAFNGEASRAESGCARRCCTAEDAAYLRTPHTRVPAELLNRFLYKSPQHFADHGAAMRRLMPQAAHALADGTLEDAGWGPLGLSRADWQSWPHRQARAVETFVRAWWRAALTTAEPPYPVTDMFETCCCVLGAAAPLLAGWEAGPEADAHLADCVEWWSYNLLADRWPFTWWRPADEPRARVELQTWLGEHAPARLRPLGLTDLADRAALLALPYDTRWNDPYWSR